VAQARDGEELAHALKYSEQHCLEEGDLGLLSHRVAETAGTGHEHEVREVMNALEQHGRSISRAQSQEGDGVFVDEAANTLTRGKP